MIFRILGLTGVDWHVGDGFVCVARQRSSTKSKHPAAPTHSGYPLFEVLVPLGQKLAAPAHKNDAYEEILYGIEGVLTWTVDGTPIEVGPGQALCIPRAAVHRFDNLGNEDVKQLAVISPAIMGPAYFREAAEVIKAAGGGPPNREKMTEVFRRHGMTLAAPPPVK
jgi:quercetin dioxygenase-like cupin family protein